MIDPHGRTITYLRLSVTDRCDLRCVYCMPHDIEFLPKSKLLSLEELARLGKTFIRLGVRKLRLTGGEPLVRRDIMALIQHLGAQLGEGGLDELTLTTNGTQLARHAQGLADCGVKRINVSMDSLNAAKFQDITRGGSLAQVMDGLDAAQKAGLAVKINAVALKGVNQDEMDDLIRFCGDRGFTLCLIETMPLGDVADRLHQYLPLTEVRRDLARRWTLVDSLHRTGGPARYVEVAEAGIKLGFITPMTHNFCEGCNRVRVTCTGTLYMCLGQEDAADLRLPLRVSDDDALVEAAILEAIGRKPKGHDFIIDREHQRPALARSMSVTGG